MTTQTKQHFCCPAQEDIVAYLRYELLPDEKDNLRLHLERCKACSSLADDLQSTIEALKLSKNIETSRDLTSHILAQIPDKAWGRQTKKFPLLSLISSPVIVRAAALIILTLGVTYLAIHAWQNHYGTQQNAETIPHQMTAINKHHQSQKEGNLWLIQAQDTSGKWDPAKWGGKSEYTIGLTGLALLSIARTETMVEQDCVQRATDYLLSHQNNNGRFGDNIEGAMYNHGIATVALMELYKTTRNPALTDPLQKALTFIAEQQLDSGGWGYRKGIGVNANSSISTWPLQALLLSPNVEWQDKTHAIQMSVSWLLSMVDPGGQFGYQKPEDFPNGPDALTAMGAYCVLRAANQGININEKALSKIKNALAQQQDDQQKTNYYRTYFRICALNEDDDAKWTASLENLQHEIISQKESSGPHKGSWNPQDPWGTIGGRIYSTALASLSLQNCSRYQF